MGFRDWLRGRFSRKEKRKEGLSVYQRQRAERTRRVNTRKAIAAKRDGTFLLHELQKSSQRFILEMEAFGALFRKRCNAYNYDVWKKKLQAQIVPMYQQYARAMLTVQAKRVPGSEKLGEVRAITGNFKKELEKLLAMDSYGVFKKEMTTFLDPWIYRVQRKRQIMERLIVQPVVEEREFRRAA